MSYENLGLHLKAGHVYRREMLLPFSNALDRDLLTLTQQGVLEKVAPGLYHKPVHSRFGTLPANDKALVKSFLRGDPFLLYSWNEYNTLGLGLTQLYNCQVVYNHKRHGVFNLGGKQFDFRRPAKGFPRKLSKEFLLVDLLNNISELSEDSLFIKEKMISNQKNFDWKKVDAYAKHYGKVATKKMLKEINHQHSIFT